MAHVTLVDFPPIRVAHRVTVGTTSAQMVNFQKLQKPNLHIAVRNILYHLAMSRLCNANDIIIFMLQKHILTACYTHYNL